VIFEIGLRVKKLEQDSAEGVRRREQWQAETVGESDVGFGSARFRLTTNGVINLSNRNTQTAAALLSTALTAARPITTVFPNTGFSLFRKAHTTPMNRS